MITLDAVSLLRNGRALIKHVSLALALGQTTVIIGPNGAGKSTLVRLLSGELEPSSGTIAFNGAPLHTMDPRHLAARRAVLAQANETAFGFTVSELAALGLRLLDLRFTAAQRANLVERALHTVGLAPLADRPLGRLSGGERQRAHLARVLTQLWAGASLHGPGLLLLDEPIAAQDLAHQLEVLEIAHEHATSGGGVIVVLHDLNWAARIADRLIVLNRGSVYADGPPAGVLTQTMLADVFAINLQPGATPPAGSPFVLPQLAVAASRSALPPHHPPGETHVHRHEPLQGPPRGAAHVHQSLA
ncbi:MAG: heme ABC transporter ATP-binding protein [Caulobacteraceae bacterium]